MRVCRLLGKQCWVALCVCAIVRDGLDKGRRKTMEKHEIIERRIGLEVAHSFCVRSFSFGQYNTSSSQINQTLSTHSKTG